MWRYYHNVSNKDLIESTRALLIFCQSHGWEDGVYIDAIDKCLGALKNEDFDTAFGHFKNVPFGGMGTFTDWWPSVVYANEDPEYVTTVFLALSERWHRLMRVAGGEE
jgi:hypothetical protein